MKHNTFHFSSIWTSQIYTTLFKYIVVIIKITELQSKNSSMNIRMNVSQKFVSYFPLSNETYLINGNVNVPAEITIKILTKNQSMVKETDVEPILTPS